jgi:hypothetical protein
MLYLQSGKTTKNDKNLMHNLRISLKEMDNFDSVLFDSYLLGFESVFFAKLVNF